VRTAGLSDSAFLGRFGVPQLNTDANRWLCCLLKGRRRVKVQGQRVVSSTGLLELRISRCYSPALSLPSCSSCHVSHRRCEAGEEPIVDTAGNVVNLSVVHARNRQHLQRAGGGLELSLSRLDTAHRHHLSINKGWSRANESHYTHPLRGMSVLITLRQRASPCKAVHFRLRWTNDCSQLRSTPERILRGA